MTLSIKRTGSALILGGSSTPVGGKRYLTEAQRTKVREIDSCLPLEAGCLAEEA
jgi:hypothetical protein